MRRLRTILAVAVATTAVIGTLAVINRGNAKADINQPTWSDEFDGPAGSAPNPGRWGHDIGGNGWNNRELEYHTSSTDNAALDGAGHLVITARQDNAGGLDCWYGPCKYTSARLLTASHFTQAYGHFEARIKIPAGQGMWPAFWALGTDPDNAGWPARGEIDVMENVGFEPSKVHGTLHGPGYSGGAGLTSTYSLPGGQKFADDFHTFAADWAPGSVTFSVDGQQYSRKTPADTRGNRWVFDHPFFIILNLAVGGDWPGSPDSSTAFPQRMVVDYVRVSAQRRTPPDQAPNPNPGIGPVVGLGSNRCIDIPGAVSVDGAPLQIWDCNGTGAQQWTFEADGTVHALGRCMDVAWGSTRNGAAIQLVSCNGSAAQHFVLTASGDLMNPQSGKCVDVQGRGKANGARLIQWQCHGGSNQKWLKKVP